ncbi:MAG: RNA polymerase sigma factor [Deltaproteobacteria bacterium]|nr:RNA polymerase sigma factor [Deltaproteobacteria bacterium]
MTLDPNTLFVERFHAGDRDTLAVCYRDHHRDVLAAATKVLGAVDAETVTHEVFYRLLTDATMRASFRGGDLGAWLSRVVRNRAIDYRRRHAREAPLSESSAEGDLEHLADGSARADADGESVASMVIERFVKERLPPKWAKVFEVRFLQQLGQREAAAALGMRRTTLMYQEHRIRSLLRAFVLEES